MEDAYGYVYIITNKLNGKSYIGQKKSAEFNESYWGSGKLITAALAKYGKDNFTRKVLQWCSSKESLNDAEIYWIDKLQTTTLGYNLSPGGNGGYLGPDALEGTRQGMIKYFSNPENRKKQSEAHKGKPSFMKGKTKENCESVRIAAEKLSNRYKTGELVHASLGKKRSDEFCSKQSELRKGQANPFYGKHHTQQSKEAMAEKLRGHVVTAEQRVKISIANAGERNGMYGKTPPNRGKISITDGVKNKYIDETELPKYIQQGWTRGSTQRRKKD